MKTQIEEVLNCFDFKQMFYLVVASCPNRTEYPSARDLRLSALTLLERAIKQNLEIVINNYFIVINTPEVLELHASLLFSRIIKEDQNVAQNYKENIYKHNTNDDSFENESKK